MSQRFQFHTQLFLEHFPFQWAIQFILFCNGSGTFWAAAAAGHTPARAAPPSPDAFRTSPSTPSSGHFSSITSHRYIQLCAKGISAPTELPPWSTTHSQTQTSSSNSLSFSAGLISTTWGHWAACRALVQRKFSINGLTCLSLTALTLNAAKGHYFAKVEGTPQLTILQYFQQIGTQVILIFS